MNKNDLFSSQKAIVLDSSSAQFLLKGVQFFLNHPQEKEWNHLDRESFFFLAQTLTQKPFSPEEESPEEYLERITVFLQGIISNEITAPSLPSNLEETVRAFEEFKKTQDAQTALPQSTESPTSTIKDWIQKLKKKKEEETVPAKTPKKGAPSRPPTPTPIQELEAAVKATLPALPEEKASRLAREITRNLKAYIPQESPEPKSPLDQAKQTQDIITAALPDIAESLVKEKVFLNPQETKIFISKLTAHTTSSLKRTSLVPKEKPLKSKTSFEEAKETLPFLSHLLYPKEGKFEKIRKAVEKNPTLIYTSAPEGETPVGEQIENIFSVHGINPKSVNLVQEKLEQENPDLLKFSKWRPPERLPIFPYSPLPQEREKFSFRQRLLIKTESFLEKTKIIQRRQTASGQVVLVNRPLVFIKKIFSPLSSLIKKTKFFQKIKSQGRRQLASLLGKLKITTKKGAQKAARKGVQKFFSFLTTKLAGTKIGAWLGSIAPGVGNLVGSVIGFFFDVSLNFIKKGIRFTGSFFEKLTGSETEAERKTKIALGPFSFLVSPLILIIIAAIGAPLILTVFLNKNTSGALIPSGVGGEQTLSLPSLPPNQNNGLAEEVAYTLSSCSYTDSPYINKNNKNEVFECLKDSSLPSDVAETIISGFEASIDTYSSLQCVGFVRAIEAAQGRTLPSCGEDAKDWATSRCWKENESYQFLEDKKCSQVEKGTIAVVSSGQYGHIGIISKKMESEAGGITRLRFVSAYGNPNSNSGGKITVQEIPCDYFDAFIKIK